MVEQAKWHTQVREMPHAQGFSFPVFEWSYGMEGLRGGEVRVWSLQRRLSCVNRRGGEEQPMDAEGALYWVKVMGWPEPPNFLEVLAAMATMPDAHNQSELVVGFEALKAKWEALV